MKLFYQESAGWCEVIRFILYQSKAKFKEVIVDLESQEYLIKEGIVEFGTFPILEEGKK